VKFGTGNFYETRSRISKIGIKPGKISDTSYEDLRPKNAFIVAGVIKLPHKRSLRLRWYQAVSIAEVNCMPFRFMATCFGRTNHLKIRSNSIRIYTRSFLSCRLFAKLKGLLAETGDFTSGKKKYLCVIRRHEVYYTQN